MNTAKPPSLEPSWRDRSFQTDARAEPARPEDRRRKRRPGNKNNEAGQATVLTVVFLTALLGMAALVLDLGAWFRADRQTQSTADAAALAGAQELPYDTGSATTFAVRYADKNGGGLGGGGDDDDDGDLGIEFSSRFRSNDTITVRLKRPADGVFTKLFGIDSIEVGSKASARTAGMRAARYAAPITVKNTHPKLAGGGCPCFRQLTTLPLGKTGAPGAFALINLDGSHGGTGPGTLAEWMLKGYDGYLPIGGYFSDPGAKWNSSQVQDALRQRIGTELLFPVYDVLDGSGANARYHVIGWVGFHLTDLSARGSEGSITGWFTQVIWEGIQVESGSETPDFGARAVQLID